MHDIKKPLQNLLFIYFHMEKTPPVIFISKYSSS